MGRRQQREIQAQSRAAAQGQIDLFSRRQAEASERVAQQRQLYEQFQFENPFSDMENVFEDVTVSQEAARFQMEQAAQQRANIMQGFRGAAGASGVAGLAQALAAQGTLQTRQVAADIARQEAAQQQLRAQGAAQVQMAERQGQMMLQQAQFGRRATVLGMEYGELAGARQAEQMAYGNQMAAMGLASQMQSARMGMFGQIVGGVAQGVGTYAGLAAGASERKLKRNITLVGKSPSGLNIYNFEYINPKHGEGVYQGVMSDEVPKEAVLNHPDGYEMVDYNLIDVNFKKIK